MRLALTVGLAVLAFPAAARAVDEPTWTINPPATDAAIVDTTPTRGNHLVWVPAKPVGRLLVFLPTGGPTNIPSEFRELGTVASGLGYHTVMLAYRNEAPIAANPPAGCGSAENPSDPPDNCAINIRTEMLDGVDTSPVVSINPANSIDNRLRKLLAYLAKTHPTEGWAQFADASGEPKWAQIVVAGSSLGAGEAVILAERHELYHVALLHGWTDAKHGWVKAPSLTPASRYSSLIHLRDNFYARTCPAYVILGLAPGCPLINPPLVENQRPPFAGRQLVFNLDPAPNPPAIVADPWHSSTSRDGWINREADGSPSHHLVNAWRAVLGDTDADAVLDEVDNCPLVANPGQGDVCPRSTVGGTVPATLALTIGVPASFGAFTPGVSRTYDAGTTANVVSTAGDATLGVGDPGHLSNGSVSLPEPLQVSFSRSSWSAPASNDVVTIAFRQAIKATDALRTGTYRRTLTFTLSTTTP